MTTPGWQQVRLWRKQQRATLIEQRMAIRHADRACWSERITVAIQRELAARPPARLGFYWPFKGEYDPRAVAESLHAHGIDLALPVVVRAKAPLEFRAWQPGERLESGVWGIPIPADGEVVQPDTLLVPLVGYDRRGFRLGYGGGFYDRTLAAMSRRPVTLGLGFSLSSLDTIFPQPHDIAMDLVITELQAGP
jgi:5-formyltetrahydrofolate cyclo-ligase